MRWIVGITAALLCLGWLACHIDVVSASPQQPSSDDGWRRTTKGWERHVSLTRPIAATNGVPFWRLHPHPLIATLLLVMLSVLLLVAFTEGAIFDSQSHEFVVANYGSSST